MQNSGGADIKLRDKTGHDFHMVFQNTKVSHPIMSGRKLLRKGCEVRLKGRGGWIKLPDGHKVEVVMRRGVLWCELEVMPPATLFSGPGL